MLTTIFYEVDEFCKHFEKEFDKKLLLGNKSRARKGLMLSSEVITIAIFYHYSGYKNFKAFYCNHVKIHLKQEFPNLVSYNRFIELKQKMLVLIALFTKLRCLGKSTGIAIIDSTSLKTCHIRRSYSSKLLKGFATKGVTSTGWFLG